MSLAGLISTSESMFPGLAKSVGPSADEMADAFHKMQFDRRVLVSGYQTAVFDMHSAKDRARYSKCMLDLSEKTQARTACITAHERKMLPRKDGSAGWFNYLEWVEFRLDERKIATCRPANGDKNGKA